MDKLIYTAMTGANAAANRQAVLANNLANVSTNGFRAELSTYRAVPVRGDGATTRVMALEATPGFSDLPGSPQRTGRAMDAMTTGNSWFAVQGLVLCPDGNAPQALEAVAAAHGRDMIVVALSGKGGGRMGAALRETDVHICVPHERLARIQEVHLLALHCICDGVDAQLLGEQEIPS